ncbi:uncharacterized protein OCT59_029692 [Rhizophagus irregularis]|uniref:uncharacterized protein n=1 Tax=Rhizophagus irregularis TaxID=588596 RepID=UPI00333430EC|nr:hypothetical protein OCT59_029692 [Rhizophagus irregularis]
MPKSNRCSSIPKYPRVETIQEQELEGENNNQKGHIKGGIARMGTNSALCASSSAIKRVMEGRIAHLGHQFGTSYLIPWQSKSEGMDCEMSSANRWIANSALCASSGN